MGFVFTINNIDGISCKLDESFYRYWDVSSTFSALKKRNFWSHCSSNIQTTVVLKTRVQWQFRWEMWNIFWWCWNRILDSFQRRLHRPPQHSSWNWIRPCCLGEPGRCLGYIFLFNNVYCWHNLGGRVTWTNLKWDRPLKQRLLREHPVLRQRAYFWLILDVGFGVIHESEYKYCLIYNDPKNWVLLEEFQPIHNFRFFPRNEFLAFVFEVLSFNFSK